MSFVVPAQLIASRRRIGFQLETTLGEATHGGETDGGGRRDYGGSQWHPAVVHDRVWLELCIKVPENGGGR
jgi:hypothetical protein